ncbi:fam-h protein [Plasmodium relictum]|uniref:Fam-h protein n=1 Tax=Plasmodium relictum TaxID=85471 RepID=A0A1J1H3U2_PLARL|nr:fam-h protein [Plasmodium relictum]CRG99574.1 fam-h protein [Plasmodium relictum]
MDMKSNNISNIGVYPEYHTHIAKVFITTDMSTLKIYNKKEKKNIIYFSINFFIFSLLIWILQCSNTWDSFRSWNYKNDSKSVLNLGAKRSLVESEDVEKQAHKRLKFYNEQDIIRENLESESEKNEIEGKIDSEKGNEIETIEKSKIEKFKERILGRCQNYLKLIFLVITFLLSSSSLALIIDDYIKPNALGFSYAIMLANISVLIFSSILFSDQIKKKYKKKS